MAPPRKYATDEERRLAVNAAARARVPSEKERANRKLREQGRVYTPEQKARRAAQQKAHRHTPAGVAAHARRLARLKTPEKRAIHYANIKRYQATEKYRETTRARLATPEGKIKYGTYAKVSSHNRRKAGAISTADVADALRSRICHYCGVGIERMPGVRRHPCKSTLDHKIPLSRGGTHARENLVAACYDCNNRKGAQSVEKFLQRVRA